MGGVQVSLETFIESVANVYLNPHQVNIIGHIMSGRPVCMRTMNYGDIVAQRDGDTVRIEPSSSISGSVKNAMLKLEQAA